ncbi:M61 family peptidase [Bremerella cremea]|uniref:M61 family peptidase n=1 Tax=Bremerella cremea TaxID=1031537 RepID=A0A368KN44_9BACT|nr:M61 family metallopeptidase [Bremerella cremea]RCS44028.1 M61 family peptidase [Bremerella cremea]
MNWSCMMLPLRCFVVLSVAWAGLPVALAGGDETEQVLTLDLDASEISRNLLHGKMTFPVSPGPLTLVYPKWIQGEHGPNGHIADLVGLKFTANGQPIAWRRDDFDAYQFHLEVPAEVSQLEAELELIISPQASGYSRAASTTDKLGAINWYQIVLYNAAQPIDQQTIRASLTLPEKWELGGALPVAKTHGSRTDFAPVSVETLCDSPTHCGLHCREIAIGPAEGPQHSIFFTADDPAGYDISPEMKSTLDNVVTETQAVFGEPPYRSYQFLLMLSDHIGYYGMEHHESSDNRGPLGMVTDPLYRKTRHGWLLCHEFVHAWNGKYRRPIGMSPPDHHAPLKTDMLWVYEGLTHYYGFVLAVRSGFWDPQTARDNFARIAARAEIESGREWRSLEDTAIAAHYQYRAARPDGWYRRRGTDFYDEAAMVWLEADTLIRQQTHGKKSLDDFCLAFYANGQETPRVDPFTYQQMVACLNEVAPYDWDTFFNERVRQPGAQPPTGGITRGGWQLTVQTEPTEYFANAEKQSHDVDLSHTLGIVLQGNGTVEDIVPGSPADQAGVIARMKLIAVDGDRWTPELIRAAIADPGQDGEVELLFERNDRLSGFNVTYRGGNKYPTLTRATDGSPDYLSDILAPRK